MGTVALTFLLSRVPTMSSEIVLSQGTKIDLIKMTEEIEAFTEKMDVDSMDDETLDELETDVELVAKAAEELGNKIYESKITRQSHLVKYMRYDTTKLLPLIELIQVENEGVALDNFTLVKWHGYHFKLKEFESSYVLRCFEDGYRDLVVPGATMGPKEHKCVRILGEREDIECMATQNKCTVYEFLTTQIDERLEFIVAFHLL